MGYDWVFFDLDGTLTDPALGITNSILFAMERAGMDLPPREALYRFIGPPLLPELQRAFGLSPAGAEAMLRDFRVYFTDRGIFENRVYDGIPALLDRLRGAGLRLAVATSKPEPFAEEILAHFGLADRFALVAGSGMDERHNATKGEVIADALRRAVGPAPGRVVMVGDRRHDVAGALANGLVPLGVLYGYGSRRELTEAGASRLAETVEAVGDCILA